MNFYYIYMHKCQGCFVPTEYLIENVVSVSQHSGRILITCSNGFKHSLLISKVISFDLTND